MVDLFTKPICFSLGNSDHALTEAKACQDAKTTFRIANRDWYVVQIEHIENHATDYHKVWCVELTPLRKLRMWHWRMALSARRNQEKHEQAAELPRNPNKTYNATRARYHKRIADFHIRAVQALNDVVDGTAERDCSYHAN